MISEKQLKIKNKEYLKAHQNEGAHIVKQQRIQQVAPAEPKIKTKPRVPSKNEIAVIPEREEKNFIAQNFKAALHQPSKKVNQDKKEEVHEMGKVPE